MPCPRDVGMTNDETSGQPRLARSGVTMAIGTAASRGTGFLRTVVIAAAMGLYVGDCYNVANTIPNIIYDLLLGGVLTSVVVPLLVRAARENDDNGEAYAQRLVTIVVASLSVVSVIGVALAPQLIRLYTGHRLSAGQYDLATMFARYFLPQILFYGVGAVYGAILNTRGSFAAPMWAPVLNNLVVIAAGGLFFAMVSGTPQPGALSQTQRLVLEIGTTGGVVLQTIALVPALRHVGFRHRFRFDWRNAGLGSAARFASWIVGYVVTNQLGYLVIVKLAFAAGHARGAGGSAYSPYTYAFILFSLPYAVIAVTVVTALFPRMSRSAADGDLPGVSANLATGLTTSAVLLVPATVTMVTLGPLIGTIVFAHGNIHVSGARLIGGALAGFAIGLVPFSAFQIQLRAFLAMHDSLTPAVINLGVTAVNVAADVLLYLVLPGRDKVVGLAIGFAVSYLVGALVQGAVLRHRLGAFDRRVARTHVRLAAAGLVAAVPTYAAARLLTAGLGLGVEAAFAAVIVAALAGGAVFLGLANRMRIDELGEIRRLIRFGVRPS
jgi:putative peptidoglycan lipid II flippase